MDLSQLHRLTLQVLRGFYERFRTKQTSEAQFKQDFNAGHIRNQVAFQAYRTGLWRPIQPLRQETPDFAGHSLPEDDTIAIVSILWQMVGLGILVPRTVIDTQNQFFDLTGYGGEVLGQTEATPYDPIGFKATLRQLAPNLERETLDYVDESLDSFIARHFRAAAVMLGVASENEIFSLTDLYGRTLTGNQREAFRQAMNKCRNTKERFDRIYQRLEQIRGTLPQDVQELEVWLQGTFQVIRLYRNDSGHPKGLDPPQETVYASLTMFLTYARNLSRLKEYLRGNAHP